MWLKQINSTFAKQNCTKKTGEGTAQMLSFQLFIWFHICMFVNCIVIQCSVAHYHLIFKIFKVICNPFWISHSGIFNNTAILHLLKNPHKPCRDGTVVSWLTIPSQLASQQKGYRGLTHIMWVLSGKHPSFLQICQLPLHITWFCWLQ